jgi:hypothetical protein
VHGIPGVSDPGSGCDVASPEAQAAEGRAQARRVQARHTWLLGGLQTPPNISNTPHALSLCTIWTAVVGGRLTDCKHRSAKQVLGFAWHHDAGCTDCNSQIGYGAVGNADIDRQL